MRLPFIKDDTKDVEKKKFHKVIQDQVWVITKKTMMMKLVRKDVDKLKGLYDKYFLKYPDAEGKKNADKRIEQLYTLSR